MTLALRSRLLRSLTHYRIPEAGAQIGLGRTLSYDEAAAGNIPVEEFGRFKLVPKLEWDAIVRDLHREARAGGKPLLKPGKTKITAPGITEGAK